MKKTKFPGEGKIFGLQRSGTNFTNLLMRKNYSIKHFWSNEQAGWKHGAYTPDVLGQETNLVIVVKHPLCWLVSFHRYVKKNQGANFAQWARGGHWVAHWNSMMLHWIRYPLVDANRIVVRYEELIRSPEKVCDRISNALGLTKNDQRFYIPERTMNRNNTESKVVFDLDYYKKKVFMEAYGRGLLANVSDRIDWGLVKELGYDE